MSERDVTDPKVFISYSWSSPNHETWVIDLATQLEESGVHVILDKWDLGEGADKFAFMEQMVSDPGVSKVIVVCDRVYAEKADGRQGGVGTETQIMSKEVYEQVAAANRGQKFVALITEKDENGDAYTGGRASQCGKSACWGTPLLAPGEVHAGEDDEPAQDLPGP